jgi:hypothetical protein
MFLSENWKIWKDEGLTLTISRKVQLFLESFGSIPMVWQQFGKCFAG